VSSVTREEGLVEAWLVGVADGWVRLVGGEARGDGEGLVRGRLVLMRDGSSVRHGLLGRG